MDIQIVKEHILHFIEVAKEVNYDPSALYEKEPLMLQIIAGVIFVIILIIIGIIKSKMRKAGANRAISNLDGHIENFDEYQKNLQKVLKVIKGAKEDFLESIKVKKDDHYKGQLRTLKELPFESKITKYQDMASLYKQLSDKTRDEKLMEFYSQKSEELLEKELIKEINEYMQNFNFSVEDVDALEKIVAYANTKEDPQTVLNIVMEKLQNVDFGSNLDRYNFIQNLDEGKLGEIYHYIKEQQDKLFENANSVVSAEVLEYLLENNQTKKVISYIKALKVPTHLQELYYRFFDQKNMTDLDFAFISNPLEINQDYENYAENLITKHWRDDLGLEKLLEYENLSKVVGHDRIRQIIERIDALRKEANEENMAQEALDLAKEAHKIALETKTLLELQSKENKQEEKNSDEEDKQEEAKI